MSRVLASLITAAAANSISSCGSASDHIQVTSISLDADAQKGPRKGKPFTITIGTNLDKAHQHGTVVIDANLEALGIVKEPIALTQKYDFLPGLGSGEGQITIGPITFPRAIPGVFDFTGKITIVDENEEPALCLDLALHIPKILDEELELEVEKTCTPNDSTDHIRNFQNPDDQTLTMDVDEALSYVNLGVDISVKVPIVPAVGASLASIPISFSPAIPAGQILFRDLNSADAPSNFKQVVTVTGSLQLADQNSEQQTCIVFTDDSAVSV